ncbi:helix-turn-helix domain-containing protein [Nocardia gipuzkoensis]
MLFEQVGVKAATIEEVARKAGVDRVTIYRHVGGRDDLVQAVIRNRVPDRPLTDPRAARTHRTADRPATQRFRPHVPGAGGGRIERSARLTPKPSAIVREPNVPVAGRQWRLRSRRSGGFWGGPLGSGIRSRPGHRWFRRGNRIR